jgi:hypothetical protein
LEQNWKIEVLLEKYKLKKSNKFINLPDFDSQFVAENFFTLLKLQTRVSLKLFLFLFGSINFISFIK